jgi:chitin disaccharide deacetylase
MSISISNIKLVADDYGLCESVNEGIIETYLNNNINFVSIFSNMSGLEHGLNLLRKYPKLKYGLHFSLNRGGCVNKKSTLCDGENYYSRYELLKKIYKKKINPQDVKNELLLQIKNLEERGFKINTIDTDNHMHHNLFILKSIKPILDEKKISLRRLKPPIRINFNTRYFKQIFFYCNDIIINKQINNLIYRNDLFISPYDSNNNFQKFIYLVNTLVSKSNNTRIEIMLHPYKKNKEILKIYSSAKDSYFLNNCYNEFFFLKKKNIFNLFPNLKS